MIENWRHRVIRRKCKCQLAWIPLDDVESLARIMTSASSPFPPRYLYRTQKRTARMCKDIDRYKFLINKMLASLW